MAWAANLMDRPALEGLERISRSFAKRFVCLVCGESWSGSHLTAHVCPNCDSDQVEAVAA